MFVIAPFYSNFYVYMLLVTMYTISFIKTAHEITW